jgi:hypothetical protein
MAGALIALWFAQLAPQFAANRIPVGFMNVRPVGWLFRIALTAEAIGLTRPGSWLAAAVRPEPQIPGSSKERYVQAVDQYSGLGMTIVSKDWRLGPDTNTLDYSCSASIAAHGVAKIVDKGILVRLNSVRNFQWSGSYRVADESLPDDLLYDNFEDTVGRGGPWKSMRVEIRPAFGDTFVYGSTVISRAQVIGTFATHDCFLKGFYVIGPTKLFRVSSLLRGRRS